MTALHKMLLEITFKYMHETGEKHILNRKGEAFILRSHFAKTLKKVAKGKGFPVNSTDIWIILKHFPVRKHHGVFICEINKQKDLYPEMFVLSFRDAARKYRCGYAEGSASSQDEEHSPSQTESADEA